MPLPLLFALFLAFGFDPASSQGTSPTQPSLGWNEVSQRSLEIFGGFLVVGVVAYVVGLAIAFRLRYLGKPTGAILRIYRLSNLGIDMLGLLLFGLLIHLRSWPRVVRSSLGVGDSIFVDDALIFLPFLLIQISGWWGLYTAERAIREARGLHGPRLGGVGRFLWLKSRQSLGMILPVALVYGLGTDIIHRVWPWTAASSWEQPAGLIVMGVLVLLGAPALIRLAWPTHSLPAGPLRARLEHVANRVGFQCTDILVWDTSGMVVNAGVTGSLPWFRYVFLTDALIEELNPHEVAAVFGHEIGHIAHRHLVYFGFFVLGSLGVLALASGAINQAIAVLPLPPTLASGSSGSLVVEAGLTLLVIGAYFFFLFGLLSRFFEGQADVFGCKVVSCGQFDCPPHEDLDGPSTGRAAFQSKRPMPLCAVGVQIFINALETVAARNGMKPRAWSWRHGSILRRIAFLESLMESPGAERRFQLKVSRMRWVIAVVVGAAACLAVAMLS
jgi:STE24 endopeptidase